MQSVLRNTTLAVFLCAIFSCQQVTTKGRETLDKSRQVMVEKKDNIQDKFLNRFDAYSADTRFNKKRFQEFFGFPPPEDVRQLYCYADRLGIDAKYQFGFH